MKATRQGTPTPSRIRDGAIDATERRPFILAGLSWLFASSSPCELLLLVVPVLARDASKCFRDSWLTRELPKVPLDRCSTRVCIVRLLLDPTNRIQHRLYEEEDATHHDNNNNNKSATTVWNGRPNETSYRLLARRVRERCR